MPSPVTPAEIKACIPDPNSSLCGNFIAALIKLPTLLYEWFAWAFDASGNPTKALVNASQPTGSLIFAAVMLDEDGTKLLCDGRSLTITDYPDLAALLGTVYGVAGSGQFKIPDFKARFPCGMASGGSATFAGGASVVVGSPGGEDQHILIDTECAVRAHTHDMTGHWVKDNGGTQGLLSSGSQGDGGAITGGVTAGLVASAPHNNLPPYLGVYVFIVT